MFDILFSNARLTRGGKVIATLTAVTVGVLSGMWAYLLIGKTIFGMPYTAGAAVCDIFSSYIMTCVAVGIIRRIKTK